MVETTGGSVQGLFRSWDPHIAADIAAMGVGMASISGGAGMALAAPPMLSFVPSRRSKPLPHWILVRADFQKVCLYASDRKGTQGALVLEAPAQSFRANLDRYIGEIVLTLFVPAKDSICLKGKRGPFHRGPIRAAQAVMRLAKPG